MIARLKGWLAAAGAVLALILGAFLRGRAAGKSAARAAEDAAYRKTIERTKDADVSRGDADADREWLRQRGQR